MKLTAVLTVNQTKPSTSQQQSFVSAKREEKLEERKQEAKATQVVESVVWQAAKTTLTSGDVALGLLVDADFSSCETSIGHFGMPIAHLLKHTGGPNPSVFCVILLHVVAGGIDD